MAEDFFDFRNKKNSGKDKNHPKLGKIQVIQFVKGKTKIFWKTSNLNINLTNSYQRRSGDQSRKKIPCKIKDSAREARAQKKAQICQKLENMMTKNMKSIDTLPFKISSD